MRTSRLPASRFAPSAERLGKWDVFDGQKWDIFNGH